MGGTPRISTKCSEAKERVNCTTRVVKKKQGKPNLDARSSRGHTTRQHCAQYTAPDRRPSRNAPNFEAIHSVSAAAVLGNEASEKEMAAPTKKKTHRNHHEQVSIQPTKQLCTPRPGKLQTKIKQSGFTHPISELMLSISSLRRSQSSKLLNATIDLEGCPAAPMFTAICPPYCSEKSHRTKQRTGQFRNPRERIDFKIP